MSEKYKEPLVYRRAYELTLVICRYVKDMKSFKGSILSDFFLIRSDKGGF